MDRRDDNPNLPEELKGALRDIFSPRTPFLGDDRQILAAARSAGASPGPQGIFRRWAVGIGIAAAVAVAAGLFALQTGRNAADSGGARTTMAPSDSYAPTGDIRDAFYVARVLKRQRTLEARWDRNGDGTVNEKDVQTLAAAAVRLDEVAKGATQ